MTTNPATEQMTPQAWPLYAVLDVTDNRPKAAVAAVVGWAVVSESTPPLWLPVLVELGGAYAHFVDPASIHSLGADLEAAREAAVRLTREWQSAFDAARGAA